MITVSCFKFHGCHVISEALHRRFHEITSMHRS